MQRNFRKPLVVMTPKSLLRHQAAVSPVEEFTDRPASARCSTTRPPTPDRGHAGCVLCSGKVYYDLAAKRDEAEDAGRSRSSGSSSSTRSRRSSCRRCSAATAGRREWVWVQEESQNMGGWSFVEPRLRALGFPFEYVGRDASASPATGSHHVHEREQTELVEAALTRRRCRTWCGAAGTATAASAADGTAATAAKPPTPTRRAGRDAEPTRAEPDRARR